MCSYDNHKLVGYHIGTVQDTNRIECALKCIENSQCQSFNYVPNGTLCELNHHSGQNQSYSFQSGATHFSSWHCSYTQQQIEPGSGQDERLTEPVAGSGSGSGSGRDPFEEIKG